MKKYVATALLAVTMAAHSGSQSGKIVGFVPYKNSAGDLVLFKLEGNISGGCNSSGRFAIDSTSPHYKATLAAVLAAYHAQTDVFVAYAETCNAWSNAWDIHYVCTGTINC